MTTVGRNKKRKVDKFEKEKTDKSLTKKKDKSASEKPGKPTKNTADEVKGVLDGRRGNTGRRRGG